MLYLFNIYNKFFVISCYSCYLLTFSTVCVFFLIILRWPTMKYFRNWTVVLLRPLLHGRKFDLNGFTFRAWFGVGLKTLHQSAPSSRVFGGIAPGTSFLPCGKVVLWAKVIFCHFSAWLLSMLMSGSFEKVKA